MARKSFHIVLSENGNGKSTLAKVLMGLEKPDKGSILYQGADLSTLKRRALAQMRRDCKIVFQDSDSSLNPRWPMGRSIAETLEKRHEFSSKHIARRAEEYLEMAQLSRNTSHKLSHELSGGDDDFSFEGRLDHVSPG